MSMTICLAEHGWLPDGIVRLGIRCLIARRWHEAAAGYESGAQEKFVEEARRAPVALDPEKPNAQHYALPPAFFEQVLGPRLKYSCCYYPNGAETLAAAEDAMLALTCERAELADGMRVMDLGCGWGSLSLWIAGRYPNSRVLAVSNSAVQRVHIEALAAAQGLSNVDVVTADANTFEPAERYDRILSIEILEHMRNHGQLLGRIARWLHPQGKLFIHLFCHRRFCYPYVAQGDTNWMARHFFTGGIMPSYDLLPALAEPFTLEQRWEVSGQHYYRTCMHWLANLDARRDAVLPILQTAYGDGAGVWLQRWRMFFMACAELFRYGRRSEWFVAHYRMGRPF